MLKNIILMAVILISEAGLMAGHSVANAMGPCEVMRHDTNTLEAASARATADCDKDMTLTGPCSQALIAGNRAYDALGISMAKCRAALDKSEAAMR